MRWYILCLIIYLETLYKILVFKNVFNCYTLLFSIPIILLIDLVCNLFKEKISRVLGLLVSIGITLYFIVQYIFFVFFSVPFSFSTLGIAGNAFDFTNIIANSIIKNIFSIILFFIPLIFYIVFYKKIKFEKYNKKTICVLIIIILGIIIINMTLIQINRNSLYSPYNLYYKINAEEKNIQTFGLLTATRIDIHRVIFGFKEEIIEEHIEVEEQEEIQITYNETNINFENLYKSEKDESIKDVYEYIEKTEPTNKNQYTGYFEGKNVIFILAEAFNSIAVSEELTPTLYKLTNEGFVFSNFYSPVFLSTTGGEFQATTGLIPTQETLSLWKSEEPEITYALGNSFSKKGYTANSYHNWTYTYYSRDCTMRTLGFHSYMGARKWFRKINGL